jgi:hypothetical protein
MPPDPPAPPPEPAAPPPEPAAPPPRLERAAALERRWPPRQPAALACFGLGVVAMAVASFLVMRRGLLFDAVPDPRLTVPLWAATLAAAGLSAVRRERGWGLLVAGILMASAAMALGWVLALVAVTAVALVLIHVLSGMF